jgi:hypothetical protein
VLLGNGDGSFKVAPPAARGGVFGRKMAVGDFNGDGKPDLAVVVDSGQPLSEPGAVDILLGNGDGTFRAPTRNPLDDNPTDVVVADLNGDGHADLVVTEPGTIDAPPGLPVLLGRGDGTFSQGVGISDGVPYFAAVADINGDGKPDLVVSEAHYTLGVLLNNGNGTFASPTNLSLGTGIPYQIQAGDFNHDGRVDLAVANLFDGVTVFLQAASSGADLAASPAFQGSTMPSADLSGVNLAGARAGQSTTLMREGSRAFPGGLRIGTDEGSPEAGSSGGIERVIGNDLGNVPSTGLHGTRGPGSHRITSRSLEGKDPLSLAAEDAFWTAWPE